MEEVRVNDDQSGFVLATSGRSFTPWGFNYDHDEEGRLIEDYWQAEWDKVREDFSEMRRLGANVVRVHLQVGRFMRSREETNAAALQRLRDLTRLAEQTQLYLNLTGLGCYHKQDVPPWYDSLNEEDRWSVQARFWEAIGKTCEASPAIFCYDLMNEPVVPGKPRKAGDWLGPAFAGKHFVQFITLDPKDRARPAIARAWIRRLRTAIRKHDRRHLITVGLVPWSLGRPGLSSGFVPEVIAPDLDFISVHIYPERSKSPEAIETLKGFAVGKPVVIEEMFPLKCGIEEFDQFLTRSKEVARGWFGFYWGTTPEEYRRSARRVDALILRWLELFRRRAREFVH